MARANAQPKSPYARGNKGPFIYSDEYHNWAQAVEKHGLMSDVTIEADKKFRARFGVPYTPVGDYS